MTTESKPRPAHVHDHDCSGVRWAHHLPWIEGAPVMAVCLGCTAVKRIDGSRIRMVNGGPSIRGGAR